ncbi:hypothetical protein JXB31_03545 [Candidatus Woesearchaeota archaeon]|nr:hypothetical protein [Candidatus Woesearchaeota archaeon]
MKPEQNDKRSLTGIVREGINKIGKKVVLPAIGLTIGVMAYTGLGMVDKAAAVEEYLQMPVAPVAAYNQAKRYDGSIESIDSIFSESNGSEKIEQIRILKEKKTEEGYELDAGIGGLTPVKFFYGEEGLEGCRYAGSDYAIDVDFGKRKVRLSVDGKEYRIGIEHDKTIAELEQYKKDSDLEYRTLQKEFKKGMAEALRARDFDSYRLFKEGWDEVKTLYDLDREATGFAIGSTKMKKSVDRLALSVITGREDGYEILCAMVDGLKRIGQQLYGCISGCNTTQGVE